MRTLAFNMIVTTTIPWFYLHPAFVVHSTNSPAAHMTISVIALPFNACVFAYQTYTIFGKKRNSFKTELYYDSPRFQRVYLESVGVPPAKSRRRSKGSSSTGTMPHGTSMGAYVHGAIPNSRNNIASSFI